MESVLVKVNLVILSTGQYWHIFNGEKGMLDREGHGHKAVVYKSHFLPLRHSVVTETPADTLANKPRLTKDQALCSLCPHDRHLRNLVQMEGRGVFEGTYTNLGLVLTETLSRSMHKALYKWGFGEFVWGGGVCESWLNQSLHKTVKSLCQQV